MFQDSIDNAKHTGVYNMIPTGDFNSDPVNIMLHWNKL